MVLQYFNMGEEGDAYDIFMCKISQAMNMAWLQLRVVVLNCT